MSKPSIPKGTRDFGSAEVLKRNYIFDTIRKVFQNHGFEPLETPAFELLETLTGKYGEEGDRLMFKILPRGEKLNELIQKSSETDFKIHHHLEEALRYDLTVPFARYVVQHQHEITFPFKRYQIQPVWRADRPQKGRYREFYQCDVDVIGSASLWNEVELIQILQEVFGLLKLNDVIIKLNNRKILAGIAEYIGHPDKMIDITIAIDKLEKIGLEKVKEELGTKGLDNNAITKLEQIMLAYQDANAIELLQNKLANIAVAQKGFEELNWVLCMTKNLGIKNVVFDVTLARGLNYYTGAIFEVVTEGSSSSISGGGRYDDLTGIFGLKNVSGVGISFGADRIYNVLEERNLFPEASTHASSDVLFVNFGEKEALQALKIMNQVRGMNYSCELYPDAAGLKKQFKYADDKKIAFVAIIGENEMKENKVKLKNMKSGEEKEISFNGNEFIEGLSQFFTK